MSAPIRLLLVDDHAVFRQPLAFMLEREPDLTVVAQAASVEEARAALAQARDSQPVDVALIDLQLPDGNGVEIVCAMRNANTFAQALVVTADTDHAHHARAIEAGAAGVISKTAELSAIIAAVRGVYAGESVHPPEEIIAFLRLACQERQREHATQEMLAKLTPRERQVLEALVEGLDNRAIAERLFISPETARTHVVKLLTKLHVDSRLQAAIFAIRQGIVPCK